MLPSRGLKAAHFAPYIPRRSLALRPDTLRKFSTAPRRTAFPSASCRTHPLRTSSWRTGAIIAPSTIQNNSTIRNASWYAPWSWWGSSPKAPAPQPEFLVDQYPMSDDLTSHIDPLDLRSPTDTIEQLLDKGIDISNIPEKIGYLRELGLDYGLGPTSVMQWLLEHVHIYSGFGWGASIIVTSLIVRACLFPLNLQQADYGAKTMAIAPVTQPLMNKMFQGDMTAQQQLRLIQKDAGIGSPFASLRGPIVQSIFGIGAFRLLRGMTSLPVPGLMAGGWGWISDLTISDPYFILPVVLAGTLHVIARLGGESGASSVTMRPGMQKFMLYGLPLIFGGICFTLPAALQISFLTTTLWSVGMGALLRRNWFREFWGITPLPTEAQKAHFEKIALGKAVPRRDSQGNLTYKPPTPSAPKIENIIQTTGTSHPAKQAPRERIVLANKAAMPTHIKPLTDGFYAEQEAKNKRPTEPPKDLAGKFKWYKDEFADSFRGARKRAENMLGSKAAAASATKQRQEQLARQEEERNYRKR